MADTYDDEKFIPLGIAFEQALSALEDCETLLKDPRLLPPYTATTEWPPASDPERNDLLNKYDDIVRRVERLLRDAIADRHLPLFKKAQNDQMERIVDQKEWRRLSFGIPGIENVPHHSQIRAETLMVSRYFSKLAILKIGLLIKLAIKRLAAQA
jgi:hypothetical protein